MRRRTPRWPGWCRSRACAGRLKACSNKAKAKSAWINTKCDPGSDGTATSPWRCSPSPISPPSERTLSGGVDLLNLAEELLPLTVPEVRRLLWALVSQRSPPPRSVLHWSDWQRKHQQVALHTHWHRQTQLTPRKARL